MVYLFFLLFVCLYLRSFGQVHRLAVGRFSIGYVGYLFPVIFLWCLIVGGQYGVGTDYFSYLRIFSGGHLWYLESKGDIGFSAFVRFCNGIGFSGQDLFFIFSLFWILSLLYIIYSLVGWRYAYLFMFVFIAFSSVLHNQMNILRQYCAVYLFTIGFCLLFQKRFFLSAIPLSLMTVVHSSSIATLPILPLLFYVGKHIRRRLYLYMLVVGSVLLSLLAHYIDVSKLFSYFSQYALYEGRIVETDVSWLVKLSKYVYVPVLFYAIYLSPCMQLTKKEWIVFIVGICSFCIRMSLLDFVIIRRMGAYFEILMCVPLTFLLIYCFRYKRNIFPFLILYILIPYVLKVTFFAVGEYSYASYLFQ